MESVDSNLLENEKIIMNKNNVIFLLGPTGIGKTKISLSISTIIKSEIINSDAFSLYKNANIMTAKANEKEQKSVKHHLIDILDLDIFDFKIGNYTNLCLKTINDLFQNNMTPIIVGGTNYYVESVLFEKLDSQEENKNSFTTKNYQKEDDIILKQLIEIKNKYNNTDHIQEKILHNELNNFLENIECKFLYDLLKIVDEKYANFLHFNDKRKIKNGIIYYVLTGERKSEKLVQEHIKTRHNSIIIFLNPVNFNNLESRIKFRINEMVEEGLYEIFYIFFHFFNKNNGNINLDFTIGILQAIGYKEFYSLFKILYETNILVFKELNDFFNIQEKSSQDNLVYLKNFLIPNIPNFDLEFSQCKQKLITNTVKYAKSQLKFINKRIIPFISQNSKNKFIHIDISEFSQEKFSEYTSQIEKFIKNNLSNSENDENNEICLKMNKLNLWSKYTCAICKDMILNGETEYQVHLKSNKHKKRKAKLNKKK